MMLLAVFTFHFDFLAQELPIISTKTYKILTMNYFLARYLNLKELLGIVYSFCMYINIQRICHKYCARLFSSIDKQFMEP